MSYQQFLSILKSMGITPKSKVDFHKFLQGTFKKNPKEKGKKFIGKSPIDTPQMTQLLATAPSKVDGSFHQDWTYGSLTPGAGEKVSVNVVSTIGADLLALDSTEDNMKLVLDRAEVIIFTNSTVFYSFTPFLAMMENGETIGSNGSNTSDPNQVIDAVINGVYSVKMGEHMICNPIWSNGSQYMRANTHFDITEFCRKYLRHCQRREMEEELQLVLQLGATVNCHVANTGVNYTIYRMYSYHYVENSPDIAL